MWLYKNPQAFWSQSCRISFSNVFFSAESIFAVCQAVSLAVLLLAAKIQHGRRFIGLLIYFLPGMIERHSSQGILRLEVQGILF